MKKKQKKTLNPRIDVEREVLSYPGCVIVRGSPAFAARYNTAYLALMPPIHSFFTLLSLGFGAGRTKYWWFCGAAMSLRLNMLSAITA